MIGPIMVGPSSSHTAGVVRIGLMARKILGSIPSAIEIVFYNSFATTYKGHGSDSAIVGGILGYMPDDEKIKTSLEEIETLGIPLHFKQVGNASTMHPNTIEVRLTAEDGHTQTILGESLGGGIINIANVGGYQSMFDGNLHTLILKADDKPGVIAFVADILAHEGCNIASMSVSRQSKNGEACHFIEIDTPPRPLTISFMKSMSWLKSLNHVSPISA